MHKVPGICCLLILTILLSVTGCSSGQTPTIPVDDTYYSTSLISTLPVGVSECDSNGNPIAGYGALGLFQVSIDVNSLTGEITSLRSSTATDVLEVVDITNFLRVSPCTDCVKIDGVEFDTDGHVVVYIGVKHPFDVGNPGLPVTGQNRADLHVFNIEGMVVSESTAITIFSGIGAQASGIRLVSADGYSAYLDDALDTIFASTASIHPYVLHFDDYTEGNYNPANPMGFQSVTDPPPSGNLVMAMGCDFDIQAYVFDMWSGDHIDFIYAVGCTYAVSADSKAKRFSPQYRVPQHLKKAASEVRARIVDNQLVAGDPATEATLAIDVVDINHNVPVGTGLDEMIADSSIGMIRLEVPDVVSGVKDVTLTNIGGSGHDPSDPLTYEITIQNEQAAPEGLYMGLVKVTDSYPPGLNTLDLLDGMDGIERVDPGLNPLSGLFAIPEFATYQTFDLEVFGVINDDPVAVLEPEQAEIYEGFIVDFDATGSYDTDGVIILYEYDYDWDGLEINFSADDSNTTGLITSPPYDTQGIYTAGLRVTDDLGGVDYDSSEVTVNEWSSDCPYAPFGGVSFSENLAFDDYNSLNQGNSEWDVWADQVLDADMLSTGDIILIYSDGDEHYAGTFEGELRYVDPHGGVDHTAVEPGADYPGAIGISIDVDSEDLVVFVTSDLPHTDYTNFNARDYEIDEKVAAAHDFFYVVDPFVGVSSEVIVDVGTPIMAIDIDANDDVWVLDTDNVMHKYEKSTGYTEDVSSSFDLDITSSGAFTGLVYDFVIDFYNEAFFILTNGSELTDLWRFECDGQYLTNINGNPNPITSVLPESSRPVYPHTTHGVADITIDNLDPAGNVLTGEQDSQIVVVGGEDWDRGDPNDIYWDYTTLITRVDSELNQIEKLAHDQFCEGFTNGCFNQRMDELWGFCCGVWSDSYVTLWLPTSEWY